MGVKFMYCGQKIALSSFFYNLARYNKFLSELYINTSLHFYNNLTIKVLQSIKIST